VPLLIGDDGQGPRKQEQRGAGFAPGWPEGANCNAGENREGGWRGRMSHEHRASQ
jgi:hypothetical protein